MRKSTLIAIYLVLAFLLLGLLFMLWNRRGFDWRDNATGKAYHESWEEPYGSLVFYKALDDYFPERRFFKLDTAVFLQLPDSTPYPSAYVFIGEAMYYDSSDIERLLRFVGSGNSALLISKSISTRLLNRLLSPDVECYWEDYDLLAEQHVRLSLDRSSDTISLAYVVKNAPEQYYWPYLAVPPTCRFFPIDTLGWMNEHYPNFIAIPHQNGKILLHSTPLVFSNYQLLRPEAQAYVEEVLAELPNGDVYWDACSRVPQREGRLRNGDGARLPEEHPLAYILRQPALAWTWYLLVGMALSYLLFQAKRRRRVVPILPKNENSSYEFISTIANLHFRGKNYQQICVQMMRLFLSQLRERYALVVPFDPETGDVRMDDQFIPRLAKRSEYPEQNLRDIFRQYAAILQFQPNESMMVELNQSIDTFWKNAK